MDFSKYSLIACVFMFPVIASAEAAISHIGSRKVRIQKGTANFRSPDFVDDYMVRIVRQ